MTTVGGIAASGYGVEYEILVRRCYVLDLYSSIGNLLYHTWYLCLVFRVRPTGYKGTLGDGQKKEGEEGVQVR